MRYFLHFHCIKDPRETSDEYHPITELQWSADELHQGKSVRLKGMPEHLAMKMFTVAVSPNRTDFVVTNDTNQNGSDDTKRICAISWFVE